MRAGGEAPHQVLGRLRFLLQCSECFRRARPLPAALCYVPREVQYKICKDPAAAASSRSLLSVWDGPGPARGSKRAARATIEVRKGGCLRATGEEYCNSAGLWVKLSKEQLEEYKSGCDLEEGWVLVCKHAEGGDRLVPVESTERIQRQQQLFGVDYKPVIRWEQVVDLTYSLRLGAKPKPMDQDEAAVEKLRFVPPTWTYECDEDLVHFLYDHIGKEDENLGSVKQYVDSIDVSSYTEDFNVSCLTDSHADTYWESDGSQGQHWVRLNMKKGTIVKKLLLTVDTTDENFMPKRVAVYGGEGDNLKKLNDVGIDESYIGDVCVLEDMTTHLPVIEIRIVECRDDGIDVRLRGIKIKSSRQRDLGLSADMFQLANLVRYPRLEGTDPDLLYRRAVLIQRFIKLLDSVLHHLVPAWDHTVGTFSKLKHIKQFLLLSKRRTALITQCLKDSETSKPNFMPRLYINRRLAMEHRDNPALDPSCKNAVFTQVYEGLKPSDKFEKPLDYRWPLRYDQWWECKFIAEGIIDQGGGFRDSLADMSEELCPSSADTPVPLPFFVRTSNQGNSTGEARDMYVPNPSCKDFPKYEWIGQIMGAALRGKEFLVLALPGFVWKQLTGEEVSWSKDFAAVDSVLVKLLEVMEVMDKDTFEFKFGNELTYTTVLSDQRMVELIPNGSNTVVHYEDRKEFIRLVQKARLEESKEQIMAMQAGLLKVIPQAVLDLLTWQELEKKVCGDPEVTVDALKKLTRFEDFEPLDTRVQYFWEALNNFTNEDRSRFLRFVTGRSRLPARIYIYPDKLGSETTDALPESSTCSSTLFLPNYATAKEHLEENGVCHELEEGWVLAQRFGDGGDKLVPVDPVEKIQQQHQTFGMDYKPVASWEQVVDLTYTMQLGEKPMPVEPDEAVVQKLRSMPPNWSYEQDMELGRFLYDITERDQHCKDSFKDHLNGIEVSSQLDDFKVTHLTDNQGDTYWESNGSPGQHWVRLHMKKGSVIKKLWLMLNACISSYVPRRVAVYGGPANRLQHLRTVLINENSYQDVCILRDMKTHVPVLEIRILECREQGYNVRLRGIKFKSFWERDLSLNADMFQTAQLVRYPLLEGVDTDVLYHRAIVIQRFIQLLDSVLGYLIPISDESDSGFSVLRGMKPFLQLCKLGKSLVTHCLQSSESSPPCILPKLLINRQLAREHRAHPELDPSGRNTVFTQVYENLKPSKTNNHLLNYRWPQTHSQWWECDFTTEGVIDNGGGFRDCLTDISEELCPSSGDVPVPLPFFVRTSNQGNSSSDTRDMYVPNPSCKDFPKYEWIGQLMGAALRSKEILVLALPSLVWKQLSGEEVIWSKDFAAVDVELVKLLEMLEEVDREAFNFMFGKELTYTTVRSDQRVVELIPKGSSTVVRFEDRKEFIRLVQKARLEESKEQVAAIRAGLLRVVPQAVLDLLTWQQLERKVCGNPEVTVDELKKFITFEDFDSTRIQQFWDALKNFTSEDLSRFLKFITGRSRLPVQLTIYPERSIPERLDMMPEASTCSCSLFLPRYSSVKTCEELLRFAVYNCMSIDTDKNNWD